MQAWQCHLSLGRGGLLGSVPQGHVIVKLDCLRLWWIARTMSFALHSWGCPLHLWKIRNNPRQHSDISSLVTRQFLRLTNQCNAIIDLFQGTLLFYKIANPHSSHHHYHDAITVHYCERQRPLPVCDAAVHHNPTNLKGSNTHVPRSYPEDISSLKE